MSTNNFIKNISAELISAVNNNYPDNYDNYRYGNVSVPKKTYSIKQQVVKALNGKGFFNKYSNTSISTQLKNIDFPYSDFFYLYDILEDNSSKELLIKLIAYRLLGRTKVKLPLNMPAFWDNLRLIEEHQSKDDFICIDFMNQKLPLSDLNFLSVPIKIYYAALGINIDFIIKQYELHSNNIDIQADEGDVVIDGGGCFGDTALYFANKVGVKGQVKAFEFIPKNIEIFNKNINLNPALKPVIDLVNKPLWHTSDLQVFFTDNGPGSKVALDFYKEHTGETTTLSLDDYVNATSLKKVDFIKMDIEGAEINALQGAVKTIKKFRPKLAIALYHHTNDFDSIPRFISKLDSGYKFYLSHSTIYEEETMLFAATPK